jgi:hypothetical protein
MNADQKKTFNPRDERKRQTRLPVDEQIKLVARHLIPQPTLSPREWAEIHDADPHLKAAINNILERLSSARTYCGLGTYKARTVRYARYLEVADALDIVPASIWTREMFQRAEFKILDEKVPEKTEIEWDDVKAAVKEYMELRCLEKITFEWDDSCLPARFEVTGKPKEKVIL